MWVAPGGSALGLMKLGRPDSTRGEAVSATGPETRGRGAGNPAFREQMKRGVTTAPLHARLGLSRCRSAAGLVGRGFL